MSTRYLQQYRLQQRQYTAGCPVILMAGALLKDTLLSQHVAQLKFKSISSSPITALSVEIRCFQATGTYLGCTTFTYQNLSVLRGQEFGQYIAVPLEQTGVERLRIKVFAATFENGSDWVVAPDARWGVLPPIQGYATPADLWYCTCGTVNRQDEPVCCHCRQTQVHAAQPVPCAESPQTPVHTLAPQPPAAPDIPPRSAVTPAAEKVEPFSETAFATEKKSSKRKKGILAAGIAAMLLLAVVLLLPKGNSEQASSEGGLLDKLNNAVSAEEKVVIPEVTTPSDYDTVTLVLTETEEGYCKMTYDMLHEAVPQALDFSSYDCWNLGEDIDTYLSFSHHMMTMIYEEQEELRGSGWNNIWLDISGYYTVLLFSDPTTLCGYFIGNPESLGDGKWEMTFTLCDYDFENLFRQRAAEFADSEIANYPYIKPEYVADCGAEYFYFGYGSNGFWEGTPTEQMYYLWTQMISPYNESYRKPIEQLEKRIPTAEDPFWRYFLLLDENEEILGYTLYSPYGVTEIDDSGTIRWDGKVATSFGGGSGIAQDPFIIRTSQQLAFLAQCALDDNNNNGMGGMHFRLVADLNLNGLEWTPIGGSGNSFRGNFDGNGHTITGLKVTQGNSWIYEDNDWQSLTAGLFGATYKSEIRDLTVAGEISITQTDPNYQGSIQVGGIVGNASWGATLINCHNRCNITVEDYGTESSNCNVGGITGQPGSESTLDGCYNSGNILVRTARYASAAGVAGSGGAADIFNCWNSGDVTLETMNDDANGEVGGIFTHPHDATISNCCNLGALRCDGQVGGIAAYVYDSEEYERSSIISNCYSLGDIKYTGDNRYWNPAASIVFGGSKDCTVSHCFYATNGPKPVGANYEGTTSDLSVFDANGVDDAMFALLDGLTQWVNGNNQDGAFKQWLFYSDIGYPVPTD